MKVALMQVSQAGDKIIRRVGVEEEQIKFRPSPNFKNMKKFLKSRSNYSEKLEVSSTLTEVKEKKPVVLPPLAVAAAPPKPVVVQPPLPPYPPPDSPPFNVTIKQEREDEEEEAKNQSGGEGGELSQEENQRVVKEKQDSEQNQARPRKTICKEFIRGNCKRPVCKYAHEVDISQLAGVFTFCWNYQNDVCTFPNCRFVHASVFEEAEFYRTGILPPHARSHLKKQQAPPLPPPEEVQPHPDILPPNFSNPPPPLHPSVEVDEFRTVLPRGTSPHKREWAEIGQFSTSPRELESNEHNMAKKCKNCEIMEFSLKYNKEMMDNMIQSSAEINKKIALLNKKNNKLYSVLFTLLKTSSENLPLTRGLITGGGEKEKIIEQLKSIVASSNSFPNFINEDGLKNIVGGTSLPNLMAKILCGAGEQVLPTDTSRET